MWGGAGRSQEPQQPSTRDERRGRYRTVWAPGQGIRSDTVYPWHLLSRSIMLMLMVLAAAPAPAPGSAPCPCLQPCPPAPCPGRAAPADSWSSIVIATLYQNTQSAHVPESPLPHCPHTLAQATPKTIHQSRYRTKTDRASSRFLSLTDACPLRTARARASLATLLAWCRERPVGHKPKMRSPASVGPVASEDYSYRVAGSSASRKKKKGIALSSGDLVGSTSEE